MEDAQTKLAIEALKAAGCGALAIHVESRIAELEQDNQEQCRLNAMGAEREARLMARVKELEKENASLKQDASDARKKAIEDCSELLSRQHTWITNVAAAMLVLNIDTTMQKD